MEIFSPVRPTASWHAEGQLYVYHIYFRIGLARFKGARISQWVYGLVTGWTVRDRIPAEARFSAQVQTGPGAHTASYTIGTGSIPGQSGRDVTLTTHPHQSLRLKSRAIPLLPLRAIVACCRVKFTLTFTWHV